MDSLRFKAYDILHDHYINLFHIVISNDGRIMAVIDLDGEYYGMWQIKLEVTKCASAVVKRPT